MPHPSITDQSSFLFIVGYSGIYRLHILEDNILFWIHMIEQINYTIKNVFWVLQIPVAMVSKCDIVAVFALFCFTIAVLPARGKLFKLTVAMLFNIQKQIHVKVTYFCWMVNKPFNWPCFQSEWGYQQTNLMNNTMYCGLIIKE